MKSTKQPNVVLPEADETHKKATYSLPPDAIRAVDAHWRFHETLDAGLADSKSEYVADLIRRDAVQKISEETSTAHLARRPFRRSLTPVSSPRSRS
jgi:hypothetical protein